MDPPSTNSFLNPVLTGERFASHEVPLDILADFSAYEQLVVEVAKEICRRESQNGRLPHNFIERFELRLKEIGEGSALPRLVRAPAPGFLPGLRDQFDRSRDLINQTLQAAADNNAIPSEFPKNLIYLFDKFGKNLRDDEAIDLVAPGSTVGPRYTRAVRTRILARGGFTQKTLNLFGKIVAADILEQTFSLKVGKDEVYEGAFPSAFDRDLREALVDFENVDVQIWALSRHGADGGLRGRIRLQHMTVHGSDEITAVPNIAKRLAELAALEQGWLDGEGEPVSPAAVEWVRSILDTLVREHRLPGPYLYLTPEGDIQAEWSLGTVEASATFCYALQTAYLVASHTDSDACEEMDVVDAVGFVDAVAAFIENLARPTA